MSKRDKAQVSGASNSRAAKKNSSRAARSSRKKRSCRTARPSRETRSCRATHASHASPARKIAYEVCMQVDKNNSFVRNVLDAHLSRVRKQQNLPRSEEAFAQTLAIGVTQTKGTLDALINRVLKNPSDVKDDVRCALRISTYEIIYLEKDAFASVHQGVELVRSIQPKAAGVANFALRRIAELKDSFPFANPDENFDAFTLKEAFPPSLANVLVKDLGPSYARELMQTANTHPPVFIALNYIKTTDDEVCEKLHASNIAFETVDMFDNQIPGSYRLQDAHAITHPTLRELIDEGKILVADAASQFIASKVLNVALDCSSRENLGENAAPRVLEIGAGRATKTILLQSGAWRLQNRQLNLTCIDNSDFKMKILKRRTSSYGVCVSGAYVADGARLDKCPELNLDACAELNLDACPKLNGRAETRKNPEKPAHKPQLFDVVFLDAPCTGLGTLRRHTEIRWRITPNSIRETSKLQQEMLVQASKRVKEGGALIYSTCTVTCAENENNIQEFLNSSAGRVFCVRPFSEQMPYIKTKTYPLGPDAHFVACLTLKS